MRVASPSSCRHIALSERGWQDCLRLGATGRCIVFGEGRLTGGVGAEVSAQVMEHCFGKL